MSSWTLALAFVAAALVALAARRRWLLSAAKHPSLAGHPRLARRLVRWIPPLRYGTKEALACDGAPPEIASRRANALRRLSDAFVKRFARSIALSQSGAVFLSDLRFTRAYRAPLTFAEVTSGPLSSGTFVEATRGVRIIDADGNESYDVAGSYGVNLFGHEFYKACIGRGAERIRELGPVLGPYHPIVVGNAQRLAAISALDEVSFHMSGTEAVMQAVRLARYHTRRDRVVCFAGAYHGWWGDVQPGVGNPLRARDTFVLREMDDRTIRLLRHRRDIACVLVNPIQALHPNRSAPSDSALLGERTFPRYDRRAYASWLRTLRDVCTERGIALVFDEVFVGFRIARGGAQEYFGVAADMVTYGKTVGGGLPIGVLCGKAELTRRYREERPADVCLARGTFNSHPYVMGAMHEFLDHLDRPRTRELYDSLDAVWDERARRFNLALAEAGVPVCAANLSSIWSIGHKVPSRFNWMLQYYLRRHGIALSWVGTGRLVFSLDYTDADMQAVTERFVAAAQEMREDGWWWHPAHQSNRSIRKALLREMAVARLHEPTRGLPEPTRVTPLF